MVLFICCVSVVLYSAGSGVKSVVVVLDVLRVSWFCLVQSYISCRYGCTCCCAMCGFACEDRMVVSSVYVTVVMLVSGGLQCICWRVLVRLPLTNRVKVWWFALTFGRGTPTTHRPPHLEQESYIVSLVANQFSGLIGLSYDSYIIRKVFESALRNRFSLSLSLYHTSIFKGIAGLFFKI